MKRLAIAGIIGVGTAFAAEACLPGDTRPTPASAHFQVEPSEATLQGVTTADGWTITFERFLLGFGGASIEGDACNAYSYAYYRRLFDFTVAGRQKLADVYGVGSCEPHVFVQTPFGEVLRGDGVTEDDLAMMNEGHSTPWFEGNISTTLYVRGEATRGSVTKRFDWTFPTGFELAICQRPDAGITGEIVLVGGKEVPVVATIRGDELFRESLDEGAALRFDAFADADTDGDQRVTLDELTKVPGPQPHSDAGAPVTALDGGPPSLADVLYEVRTLQLVLLAGSATCVQ